MNETEQAEAKKLRLSIGGTQVRSRVARNAFVNVLSTVD